MTNKRELLLSRLNAFLRYQILALAATTIAALLSAAPASAQQLVTTATGEIFAAGTGNNAGYYVPVGWRPNMTWRGSYTKSCPERLPDIYTSGGSLNQVTLHMKCKAENGSIFETWLVGYEFCLTDIYNGDGHLRCQVPNGSYLATCKNAQMVDGSDFKAGANYLYADCKAYDGTYHQNFLNAQVTNSGCLYFYSAATLPAGLPPFYSAGGQISNNNGVLTCEPPTQPPCVHNGYYGTCFVQSGGSPGQGGGYTCGPEGALLPGCKD